MFGKSKKSHTKSPVEDMERFYLDQFMNSPKNIPQGFNGMNPMNRMVGMNSMNNFNPMNNMNPMGNVNPMNNMNPMNNVAPMNNMNPMNNLNPMNNMNPMNNVDPSYSYPIEYTSSNYSTLPQPQNSIPNLDSMGTNPYATQSFPGQLTANSMSTSELPSLLQSSINEMGSEAMLSTPYLQPRVPNPTPSNGTGTGAPEAAAIQQSPNSTSDLADTTNNGLLTPPQTPYQPDPFQQLYNTMNKIENMNKRLRKIESYLGFRPDNTI